MEKYIRNYSGDQSYEGYKKLEAPMETRAKIIDA